MAGVWRGARMIAPHAAPPPQHKNSATPCDSHVNPPHPGGTMPVAVSVRGPDRMRGIHTVTEAVHEPAELATGRSPAGKHSSLLRGLNSAGKTTRRKPSRSTRWSRPRHASVHAGSDASTSVLGRDGPPTAVIDLSVCPKIGRRPPLAAHPRMFFRCACASLSGPRQFVAPGFAKRTRPETVLIVLIFPYFERFRDGIWAYS